MVLVIRQVINIIYFEPSSDRKVALLVIYVTKNYFLYSGKFSGVPLWLRAVILQHLFVGVQYFGVNPFHNYQ